MTNSPAEDDAARHPYQASLMPPAE